MITTGEVIIVFDGTTSPPKRKLIVCVCPEEGFYFRINTKSHWTGSIPATLNDMPFLDHDSYIACDGPQEYDDYLILEAIDDDGILGRINKAVSDAIRESVKHSKQISTRDKRTVEEALLAAFPD